MAAGLAAVVARETHAADLAARADARCQVSFSYSDGFGAQIQPRAGRAGTPGRRRAGGRRALGGQRVDHPRQQGAAGADLRAVLQPVAGAAAPVRVGGARRCQLGAVLRPGSGASWPRCTRTTPAEGGLRLMAAGELGRRRHRRARSGRRPGRGALLPASGWKSAPAGGRVSADVARPAYGRGAGSGPLARCGPARREVTAAQKAAAHAATPPWSRRCARADLPHGGARRVRRCGTPHLCSRAGSAAMRRATSARSVTPTAGRRPGRPARHVALATTCSGTGHRRSMDAGARWMLNDVAGNPIRVWDERGHVVRIGYDPAPAAVADLGHRSRSDPAAGRDPGGAPGVRRAASRRRGAEPAGHPAADAGRHRGGVRREAGRHRQPGRDHPAADPRPPGRGGLDRRGRGAAFRSHGVVRRGRPVGGAVRTAGRGDLRRVDPVRRASTARQVVLPHSDRPGTRCTSCSRFTTRPTSWSG